MHATAARSRLLRRAAGERVAFSTLSRTPVARSAALCISATKPMARCVHALGPVRSANHALYSTPQPAIPWERLGLRVLAETRVAGGSIGGDFYAFALRTPRRLAVVIGDACGRGPAGARLLPAVLPRVHELLRAETPPGRLLTEVNHSVAGAVPVDRFVTAAAFELDTRAGVLTASSAGHVPALIRRARGGTTVIGRASGPPLGLVSDPSYVDEYHHLAKGDVVVFMTDGVLEAVETDLLTMPVLRKLFASAPAGGAALHRALVKHLDGCSAERRTDDMTLVSLEVVADLCSPKFAVPLQAI